MSDISPEQLDSFFKDLTINFSPINKNTFDKLLKESLIKLIYEKEKYKKIILNKKNNEEKYVNFINLLCTVLKNMMSRNPGKLYIYVNSTTGKEINYNTYINNKINNNI